MQFITYIKPLLYFTFRLPVEKQSSYYVVISAIHILYVVHIRQIYYSILS